MRISAYVLRILALFPEARQPYALSGSGASRIGFGSPGVEPVLRRPSKTRIDDFSARCYADSENLGSLDPREVSILRPVLSSVVLLVVATPISLQAGAITLDFETFPDGTPIPDSTPLTTQFPGLTFTNTTVITAGITLNEFEFPPHSGQNVAFDDSGPIAISFLWTTTVFSGYFTYAEPLTLRAFDAGNNQVASASSAFSSNLALSGNPGSSPNELLSVAFAGGISQVTITGDALGGSFVMDDVSYNAPEPSTLVLLLTAGTGLFRFRTRKLSRKL